ncbi:MAG: DUF177 domain-containing protein [Sphingomicrobium sp.]
MSEDFEHRLPLNQIRDGARIDLIAAEAERDAVAARLGLPAIARLEAHATLSRDGDTVRAQGRVKSALTQSCVATGEPIAAHVDEAFEIRFVPAPRAGAEEDVELTPEECDTVFHDGAAIELGAAIADTLALALDPYPRSAGADAVLKEAGVISEDQAGPFAALAQLKKGMAEE